MTSRPVRRTARAEAELLAHVERIAASNLEAALRFIDAVEGSLALISEMPEMGAPHRTPESRLGGIRRWVIPRFPNYLLFYRFDGATVLLLHVLHGARDYDRSVDG